ncbi:Lipid-A-disaccharide synthase [Campylobacter majalis]|uniref:Lipid-A-disaccharide synthase n=1 Tax=Campylobacter majalis TaxID=2790656 RepID=A0ABN7K9X6_9BACT|nr:lipid-A-disaccharide synthase [Campylobacter majalis]CAD7289277.1 Lipid-A-disaccharide synthase [Campylobacter majalis]
MGKILISSLEPSANLHLAEILKHLSKNDEIMGIFDERFGTPFMKSSEFSAMGFIGVARLYLKAKKAITHMTQLAKKADAVLLIDSPAFNLPLAKAIKNANIKTPITYYILPKAWAWRPSRAKKVQKFCDNLASIFPFEKDIYPSSIYVGNPLLDELKFQKTSFKESGKIAFLPGSRKAEISSLMPIYRDVAKQIKDKQKLLVVPPFLTNNIDEIYGDVSDFVIVHDTPKALYESEFAFICSGTATLEAALIGTAFVLCFKAKAIDICIARQLVSVKHAGLANIIFDFTGQDALHTELIQEQVTPKALLDDYYNCDKEKFLKSCINLREYLGSGSSKNVAEILKNNKLL